ncbi:NAD-dependent epimerase/dehydratase family protein [Stigmatella aurantiaca]|uniref:3-beta hydroxysteroid dehydrogenase/isomerase family n=1 Tax=Stigmatella aurantiaca (strain DW4/3-1) TaxID=378806 RepID=Q08TM9_STIAD|nr:NAD-dependent epimerase/dehydratase family protein [Stigmatella aurantiaca]ADO73115.1 NAD-dependent epimerase/dehydratase family protein [Stigmatella aurantiaca DW4/3-1]EAU63835.1 3-beta hydroxysteroid dehydrogenase/isomerase family [Stigmatella aurantiaca DW4/3-1]
MGKWALWGAAGVVGQSVAAALRSQGKPYRVVGRSLGGLKATFGDDPLAEQVTWNPEDAASVRAAVRGVDTLIYLVGVPYQDFRLHPLLMQRTLEAAIAEGVERLVLIGTVYPYGHARTTPVREDHPREPHTFKGRMRKEQEDLVLAADAAGRIRGTILRLPDFYGPGVDKSFLYSAFQAALQGNTANLVGPIDVPHEFVFVPDVGPVVLSLANEPKAYGRFWNLAGAGSTTQRALVERIFQEAGRTPRFRVASKLMLRLLGLGNPFMRELVEMHYLLTHPVLMDDSALRGLLGTVHKTSYEEGIRRTLREMGQTQRSA